MIAGWFVWVPGEWLVDLSDDILLAAENEQGDQI